MTDEIIKVEHISKLYRLYKRPSDRVLDAFHLAKKSSYTEHLALNDVSLSVRRGETVGIIGTNGAGKSTILKIITGVLSPTSGLITVDGRISALLELGAGFNPEYNGIENIYLNGTMIGFSKQEIDERLQDILDFADIGDYVYQPVKSYSSGMYVRLAFAVAINIDPEILVVDEALSVGDIFFQTKCFRKFETFKEQGKTILFVSHDLNSINRYCDRVLLLDKGTLRATGNPKEMIDLYKRIMVGADEPFAAVGSTADGVSNDETDGARKKRWKDDLQLNPDVNEYGDGKAQIVDFAVLDENDMGTSTLIKGDTFTIKSKVRFFEDVKDPIFTYTFKTVKGLDITGTNTMFERAGIGVAEKGSEYVASFRQKMNLQGGNYLLSISCTGHDGVDFVVHHRLYDAVNVTVISDKDTVGFYDMDSEVKVEKL